MTYQYLICLSVFDILASQNTLKCLPKPNRCCIHVKNACSHVSNRERLCHQVSLLQRCAAAIVLRLGVREAAAGQIITPSPTVVVLLLFPSLAPLLHPLSPLPLHAPETR